MANITISVQSFLNSATNLSITIDNGLTVAGIKTAVNAAEGTPTAIMDLYFNGTRLADATVISAAGLVSGSHINVSNNISDSAVWTKQERQEYKLQLAELRRQAAGDTTATFYRAYNVLDINLLPNPYNGNNIEPDDGATTLSVGRPWTT